MTSAFNVNECEPISRLRENNTRLLFADDRFDMSESAEGLQVSLGRFKDYIQHDNWVLMK